MFYFILLCTSMSKYEWVHTCSYMEYTSELCEYAGFCGRQRDAVLRDHLESCTPGIWRYIPVHTLYHDIVCTGPYFWKFSHHGTYQYLPVRTGIGKKSKSTYLYILPYVHHGLWRYMAVQFQCST